MKACLDLHDFSVVNNRLLWLLTLKKQFPNFKVSLFTVPVDSPADWGPYTIRQTFLEELKKNLDWIQIIPHGLTHDKSECKSKSVPAFKKMLEDIDKEFKKDGLPYEKGFCAPHWRWSKGVVEVLDELGWWGAVDRRQPEMLCPKKFYQYSYCLDEELPFDEDLKLHGHIFGTPNDLGKNFDKIMGLPSDTEWHFVTDFLEEV